MNNETLWALQKLSQREHLNSLVIWVLFSKRRFYWNEFRDIYIPFDCQFLYVQHHADDVFSIVEMYNVAKNSKLETFDLGTWTPEKGLEVNNTPLFLRRDNLKGHSFVALINKNPPFVDIKRSVSGRPVFSGYFFLIWMELQRCLNFKTEFPEGLFDKDPRRTLRKREADFAVTRIAYGSRNSQYMDFSQPILEADFFAFGHRREGELDWDSYLKPFSTGTWIINLIWMMMSSLTLAIFYRIAWCAGTSEREAMHFRFTLSESTLTVFRAVCMQGSDVMPKSYSCRLIFLSIYVTALVVSSAFSAALFSLLTVPQPKSHFNSLSELFNNRTYEIAFPYDLNFQKSLETLTDFVWTSPNTLKERIMESNFKLHLSAAEGLQRICEDKFLIFIYDLPNVLNLMQNMTTYCREKIVPLDRSLFKEYVAFGFRKNTPYRKLFSIHMNRLKHQGVIQRMFRHSWPPPIPVIPTQWVEATVSDISPIICLFAVGTLFGVFVLFIEKLIAFVRSQRNKFAGGAPEEEFTLFYHE
ncbi:hypothetical protein RUM43_010296 [Polyplax serrata]|uniref:Ionotropic glutamate receptor C-terminal domain-containing protein n=1 Tax=Polyplax serrata TaxID=468196 RepID=A0AAN8P3X3_POLSC